jgi:hypothetical protein
VRAGAVRQAAARRQRDLRGLVVVRAAAQVRARSAGSRSAAAAAAAGPDTQRPTRAAGRMEAACPSSGAGRRPTPRAPTSWARRRTTCRWDGCGGWPLRSPCAARAPLNRPAPADAARRQAASLSARVRAGPQELPLQDAHGRHDLGHEQGHGRRALDRCARPDPVITPGSSTRASASAAGIGRAGQLPPPPPAVPPPPPPPPRPGRPPPPSRRLPPPNRAPPAPRPRLHAGGLHRAHRRPARRAGRLQGQLPAAGVPGQVRHQLPPHLPLPRG